MTPPMLGLRLRTVSCVLLPLVLQGCRSSPSSWGDGQAPGRPSWVDQLQESIDPVQPAEAWRASPGRAIPAPLRGRPQDLARRLEVPPGTVPEPEVDAPGGSASTATEPALPGQHQNVTVNVTTTEDGVPPETQEAPSYQPSQLEALYRGQYRQKPSRDLKQFGYDYFQGQREGADLAELLEDPELLRDLLGSEQEEEFGVAGPVPSDYILGEGDELLLNVSGSLVVSERLRVDREGKVTLPQLGPIDVAGQTLAEVQARFERAYARNHREFVVSLSLGRQRTIRVHVVGHVERPGLLEVPAQSTPLGALLEARGPRKSGSLRSLVIHRGDGSSETRDLYDLLVQGERPDPQLLRDGDVLSVPSIGKTVGVAGLVQRPAIYEFQEELTVDQALAFAGGLTPFTFTPRVQIERTAAGRGRETIEVPLTEEGLARALEDGDLLMVGGVEGRLQQRVQVRGEVVRPGEYPYHAGMRITDLIELSDGLKVGAAWKQVIVSRQVGELGQVQMMAGEGPRETSRRVLVVDLEGALAGDAENNILLEPLDLVTVQSEANAGVRPTVAVLGAVQRPGTYELTAGLTVTDLIAISGNLLPEAFSHEAELVRNVFDENTRQLAVRRYRLDLGNVLSGAAEDPVLVHGDRLVVRGLQSSWVSVRISGEVRFPGTYVFPAEARITDLMAAAGGLLPDADLRAAKFTRSSVRQLQQERFRHLIETVRQRYEAALERLVQKGAPSDGLAGRLALNQTRELLGRMGTQQNEGRVILPFLEEGFPGSPYNLTLEDRDRLHIPRIQETVSVVGHVFNPGAFVAGESSTVRSLVERCGGITEEGDDQRVYVVRADGNVQALHQKSGRLAWDASVLPGDVVLVPRAPMDLDWRNQMQIYLNLLRSGAESALLLGNLNQTDLGVNWITGSDRAPGVSFAETILE